MAHKIHDVIEILETLYPNAECELKFETAFQLLIATVLSAQTTDIKVNQVTEKLFKMHPDVKSFKKLEIKEIETYIKSIGLYRVKSRNLKEITRLLDEEYDGIVPNNYETLIKLPGVGRKTANVVLSNAYHVPAIAVDTHVYRVSNRIGLAKAKNVIETEEQLKKAIPIEKWIAMHHMLIWHGRRVCKARKPMCHGCEVSVFCDYYKENRE